MQAGDVRYTRRRCLTTCGAHHQLGSEGCEQAKVRYELRAEAEVRLSGE